MLHLFGGNLSDFSMGKNSINYKSSGVDVEAGDKLVDWLQSDTSRVPHQDRILSGVGGFASLFNIHFPELKKPCLITCTDGVGTKILLASKYDQYESIAQDLVAMCVNDLVTTGGMPLLFLDYYATSKLDMNAAQSFLKGVKAACLKSNCALVGGETAEMPGVYKEKDFDCAGFAVGIVDQDKAWGPQRVQEGDILIGIESNGFHSNGYSLLRKVFENDMDQWKETLLRPTHLYVQMCMDLKNANIHAAAHITGGGIQNIPRVIPKGLSAKIQAWEWPKEFIEVQKRTGMTNTEMLETLNCGVGFIFVIPRDSLDSVHKAAEKNQFKYFNLGYIEKDQGQGPLTGAI
jgi:phosphoribosylformylglycinamidine cyclo-ligase